MVFGQIAMNGHESIASAASAARRTGRRYNPAVTRRFAILFVGLYLSLACPRQAVIGQDGMVAWWSFDDATGDHARDRAGKIDDQVIGHLCRVNGVVKTALKCDGFTSRVIRPAASAPRVSIQSPVFVCSSMERSIRIFRFAAT